MLALLPAADRNTRAASPQWSPYHYYQRLVRFYARVLASSAPFPRPKHSLPAASRRLRLADSLRHLEAVAVRLALLLSLLVLLYCWMSGQGARLQQEWSLFRQAARHYYAQLCRVLGCRTLKDHTWNLQDTLNILPAPNDDPQCSRFTATHQAVFDWAQVFASTHALRLSALHAELALREIVLQLHTAYRNVHETLGPQVLLLLRNQQHRSVDDWLALDHLSNNLLRLHLQHLDHQFSHSFGFTIQRSIARSISALHSAQLINTHLQRVLPELPTHSPLATSLRDRIQLSIHTLNTGTHDIAQAHLLLFRSIHQMSPVNGKKVDAPPTPPHETCAQANANHRAALVALYSHILDAK